MYIRKLVTLLTTFMLTGSTVWAQQPPILVEKPHAPILLRSYEAPTVSPARLNNSRRLLELVRAGKLYLTLQDAIALAIENNLDLEVDRYAPVLAEWALQRQHAGGPLRGVTAGNSQVGQVSAGQGVSGTQSLLGVSTGGGGGASQGGNAVIAQVGPVTPNLDPVLRDTTLFSHVTSPQVNTIQSQTSAIVETIHIYNNTFQQGLITGGIVQVTANESYLQENTPDVLNPSVAPRVQVYVQHSFLQGFGAKLNSRFIRIAEKNIVAARQTFRSQLLNLVSNVINLYWDLVTDLDDLHAKEDALANAQKFSKDTADEIRLGVLSGVDIYRPQTEVLTRGQDVSIARANVLQQETLLKDAMSRNGLADPTIAEVRVVPLDHIEIPEKDDLPPLRQLVASALQNRPDIAVSALNLQASQISALGTANVLLPSLTGLASAMDVGLAGTPQPQNGPSGPQFSGGLGTALGQIFRRDFPTQRVAGALQGALLVDHIDNGDYGIDQLQLRQTELLNRRDMNQLVVDISNQTVALRQARARYRAAVTARSLQQELLKAANAQFEHGTATPSDVIDAQRNLILAQSTESGSLSAYNHARISLDQVLGVTLEKNHVSVDDGLSGHVARASSIPAGVAAQ